MVLLLAIALISNRSTTIQRPISLKTFLVSAPSELRHFVSTITILDITKSTTPLAIRPDGAAIYVRAIGRTSDLKKLEQALKLSGFKSSSLLGNSGLQFESKQCWIAIWHRPGIESRVGLSIEKDLHAGLAERDISRLVKEHYNESGTQFFALDVIDKSSSEIINRWQRAAFHRANGTYIDMAIIGMVEAPARARVLTLLQSSGILHNFNDWIIDGKVVCSWILVPASDSAKVLRLIRKDTKQRKYKVEFFD